MSQARSQRLGWVHLLDLRARAAENEELKLLREQNERQAWGGE